MLISTRMTVLLNEQVGNELAASNQYLAIAAYFDGEGLPALSKHFFKQSAEERAHALRFLRYILDYRDAVDGKPFEPTNKQTKLYDKYRKRLDEGKPTTTPEK